MFLIRFLIRWLGSQWTRFWFSAEMAGRGILANPLRSSLTILGVAIGVASVVSLMNIGEGARQAVRRQFESLGSNVVVIKAHDPSVEFEVGEALDLVDRVTSLEKATPVIHADASLRWRRTRGTAQILGVNHQFPEVRDHPLADGRFFTQWHVAQRSPVAVLGFNVGAALMGGRSPVGSTLTLNGITFRITGVLAPKGEGNAEGIDDKILIPYSTAQRITEEKTADEIWVKAASAGEVDLAIVQLGRIYRRKLGLDLAAPTLSPSPESPGDGGMPRPAPSGRFEKYQMEMMLEGRAMARKSVMGPSPEEPKPQALPGDGQDLISITSLNRLVREADEANRVMTLLLGGIAAVSLLVGGLGIMNIMLVAVTERTVEIGVRRAIGARQGDLLVQFLLEALYLSGIGAVAGVAAGIWGVGVFSQYGFETVVSLQAIKVAAGVSLGAGLIFGIYPALSASAVPPVEALRR